MDPEKTLLSCREGLGSISVNLDDVIPGLHERKRPQAVREFTDLTYLLPLKLYGEALHYCADSINAMPNTKTVKRSLTQIVNGIKPFPRDYPFGQRGLLFHSSKL